MRISEFVSFYIITFQFINVFDVPSFQKLLQFLTFLSRLVSTRQKSDDFGVITKWFSRLIKGERSREVIDEGIGCLPGDTSTSPGVLECSLYKPNAVPGFPTLNKFRCSLRSAVSSLNLNRS